MGNLVKIIAVLAICQGVNGAVLPPAELDAGGVTFDFRKISAEKFRIPLPGETGNLVDAAPWNGGEYCLLHHQKAKLDPRRLAAVKETIRWRQSDGVCHIEKPTELVKIAGKFEETPLAECISGAFTKIIELPDDSGGDYRLSFRYKARHSLGQHSYYLAYFKKRNRSTGAWEETKDENALSYTAYPLEDEWSDWKVFARNLHIPPKCGAIELIMRIDGVGDLMYRDVGLVKTKGETQDVSLVLAPHGALGNEFALSRGQPAGIGFSIRKNTKRAIDFFKCRFRLELPSGVDFLGASFADAASVKRTALPDGGCVVEFAPTRSHWLQFDESFATWNRMIAMVQTQRPLGRVGTARLDFLSSEGVMLSKSAKVELCVIDTISAVKPLRYSNGISTSGDSMRFHDAGLDGAFARFMGECGVDWLICCRFSSEELSAWRKAGISRITPNGQPANGYYMTRNWKNRPKEDRFVADAPCKVFGTKYDYYLERATCPLAVIEEREFFMTNTVEKEIKEFLKGTDGMWANWEPYMFNGRGCGCAKCKDRFEKWQARTGGTLQDFRSEIHGELMRVLDRHVRAATGGERSLGFIPGVSWREMASVWRTSDPSPETRPINYAGDLKWINPWGPYVGWNAQMPYAYRKRAPLAHFIAASDIRAQTDRDYPAGRRPHLVSFPHGMQGLDWVTQPEHLEMALDSFFFNGWEASIVYYFPQGLDARFWRAFAWATTRAAKCENFVYDGVKSTDKCHLHPVAEYAVPSGYVTTYLPQYKNVSMLQHAAYDLDGARMVAVFNFWDVGEAFFRMEVKGLAAGKYTIVDEDGVRYSNRRGVQTWSAQELSGGVQLMVGAARTKAFFIRPATCGNDAKSVMSAERLNALYQSRRAALVLAAQADARDERANVVSVDKTAEL